ncbi:MAG TPA: efflux RND transporter periplasmic adaptor subunit [Ktedonosporobacter sp.]|nr:efflux RND transporter periplasmic adaptor subunit [Ktedonosporobacter sp.]
MSYHHEQFTPEEIDEQIEWLLHMESPQTSSTSTSTRVVRELQTLAKDDQARIEKIRARLAEYAAGGVIVNLEPIAIQDYQDARQANEPLVAHQTRPRKGKRKLISLLAGLVAILTLASTVTIYEWVGYRAPDASLYQLGSQPYQQGIRGGGLIFSLQQYAITFPQSERVTSILVKNGDVVKKGQKVMQLEATQLNITISQAQAAVSAAQARLQQAQAAGQPSAIIAANSDYARAVANYNALLQQMNTTYIRDGALVAIADGVVTETDVSPGQMFQPNTPLMIIQDESKLVVHAKIPVTYYGQVTLNQPAVITTSAIPNLNIPGTVSSIVPVTDLNDTFEIWVQFDNSNPDTQRLRPGMTAFVRLSSRVPSQPKPSTPALGQDIGGGGTIYALQQYAMTYSQSERVTDLLVKNGDTVKKGDKLMQLDLTQHSMPLLQAQAAVSAAQARLQQAQAAGQPSAIVAANSDLAAATANYNALLQQTDSSTLRDGALISPGDGVVTGINVSPGQVFQPNTPLMVIQDETRLVVHAKLPVKYYKQVTINQPAMITAAAIPNLNIPGVVTSIVPITDLQADTFEVWVQFDNNNASTRHLIPGMTAFVRLQTP